MTPYKHKITTTLRGEETSKVLATQKDPKQIWVSQPLHGRFRFAAENLTYKGIMNCKNSDVLMTAALDALSEKLGVKL